MTNNTNRDEKSVTENSMRTNAILMIEPYCQSGTWVFDDPVVSLNLPRFSSP